MRLLLKIVTVLLVIIGIYFLYTYFFSIKIPPLIPMETTMSATSTAPVALVVKPISTGPTFAYWTDTKTNTIFLVAPGGKISKTFGDGREEAVSSQQLSDLHAIIPSPDGTKVVASFSYPIHETFAVFDTNTGSWERLPDGVATAAFDPSSQRLAYFKTSPNDSGLFITGLADKKSSQVLRFTALDTELRWPSADTVYLFPRPSSNITSEVWAIDLKKKSLALDERNTAVMYTTATAGDLGLKLIRSTLLETQLLLTDASSKTIATLPLLTLPSKCVFASTMLYCAVPSTFPPRVNLPEDYLKEKIFTADTFVAYDTPTGVMNIIYSPDEAIDADQLSIRGDELLFRNRRDQNVYSVSIKKS